MSLFTLTHDKQETETDNPKALAKLIRKLTKQGKVEGKDFFIETSKGGR